MCKLYRGFTHTSLWIVSCFHTR